MLRYDVIVLGAGAAGLMCAIEAAKRQRRVLVIDHSNKPGKKILMSGGGRCNFTNLNIKPSRYLSNNPHFCKSALSRYTQWDFIEWINKHQIAYHEKKLGQLFCDHKAKDILEMLLRECDNHGVKLNLNESVESIQKNDLFNLKTMQGGYECESLVIATGGLSIPTLGATPFGYHVAKQFGIKVWPTRAGLVPFVLSNNDKARFSPLSGISNESVVSVNKTRFDEAILITHKGLSGPAILQISSYWKETEPVVIDLAPGANIIDALKDTQKLQPKTLLKTVLGQHITKRLVTAIVGEDKENQPLQLISHREFEAIVKQIHEWTVYPTGTEGYRTAEVTLGGVDCDALSSKTMEANNVKGLYFIGEVVDVTGWLGGYNFQWAWSSGWAAGQVA